LDGGESSGDYNHSLDQNSSTPNGTLHRVDLKEHRWFFRA
jgi:hypothetical protein